MPLSDHWTKVYDLDAEVTPYIAQVEYNPLAGLRSIELGSAPLVGRWMSAFMLRPQKVPSPDEILVQALFSLHGTTNAGKRIGFALYTEKNDIVNETGSLYTVYLEHEGATQRVVLASSTDGITTPSVLAQSAQTIALDTTYALRAIATISGASLDFSIWFGASFASLSEVITDTEATPLRQTTFTSGVFARSYVASEEFRGRLDDFTIDNAP